MNSNILAIFFTFFVLTGWLEGVKQECYSKYRFFTSSEPRKMGPSSNSVW